ncbi:HAUS augmin-like complex subunit 7 [Amphiura filiformis]|uniref:HAUS augmin-like complex subunit 7 n=1 Tax=Amphiura filiformis TaxID=82378 RepID=UPI003B219A84
MAAVSSKRSKEELSQSFKKRLQDLDCPHVDGVDETWINELLFRPGEARIRLLQWLFARFDNKLSDLLEGQYGTSGAKMDSRLQRLLQISSLMGLCESDDIDLVRGAAATSKQATFWDKLLDIVCIADMADDPQHRRVFASPGVVSESMTLEEQFEHSCELKTSLIHQREFQDTFTTKMNHLPPDLMRMLDSQLKEEGYNAGHRPIPDIQQLVEYTEKISMELTVANNQLEEIKKRYDYPKNDAQTVAKVSHTMKLVLSEMAQLVTSFSYCFENEIRQWCNKTPPTLTQLGPAFNRVDSQLQQFNMLIQGIHTIRSSYTSVCSNQSKSLTDENTLTEDNLGAISQATLTNFHECLSVLEESLQRHEHTWDNSNTLHMSQLK